MKTKIIFFLPNLHGGGAERVAVNMLRQMDREQFDITLVCVDKVGKFLELIPSHIHTIDLKTKRVVLSILKLRNIISKINPDIVFSTLLHTHIAVDLAIIGIKKNPKTIYRSSISPKLLLENNKLSFILRKLLERAYRNANLVVAQTPEMKNEIVQYHNIPPMKIDVLFNPIDADLINKKLKNINNPFNQRHINVVAAGRLTKQKGFDTLIKSFKHIVEKDQSYRLYIIGEDINGEKEKLLHLIRVLNLTKHIVLLGFQENPYKYFYYSDLYVLSSRWEGLPNTVLENLYLKKPIVATRCIPFMDVLIKDKKNGFLVDVDDENSLSDAILNHKDIDTSYSFIKFDNSKINDIFIKTLSL